jgi:subtilase family serine protease
MRQGVGTAIRARVPARIAAFLLAFCAAAPGFAQTRLPDRIRRHADDRQVSVLRGNRSELARPDLDRGRLDRSRALERLALVFKPSPAQAADLEALLAAQQDPGSPDYQRWLSPEEFAARFGMSDADLAEVTGWLRAHGLTVHGASRSRQELYFSGSVAQVEDAFHTEMHEYLVGGELHRANAVDPAIPTAYAGVVLAVRNLSDFRPRPHMRRPSTSSRFTSGITGNHFLAPADFATIYGLDALYAAGFDGTGQKIAVVGQSALAAHNATTDVDAFRAAAGLPATQLKQVLVPGTGTAKVCDGDVTEADLDVEWSGAVAPAATVVYVFTGVASGRTCTTTSASVWDALQYSVDHDLAPVISTSYGACEAANGSSFDTMVRGWAQQANAQGQSIVAATGDTGAADCDDPNSPTASQGLAVDVPAAIPEVTGAGGTEFLDGASPSTYWAATNDAGGGSALQYVPETGWNDSALVGMLASGGGGASSIFAKPPWQVGTGVPADGKRDVPDVSFHASFANDGYLICSQGSCVNGFRAADTSLDVIGGTSAAAPSLAGILAVIAGGTGSNGLGSPNPTLYALAASVPSAFHDVTSGSNVVPCQRGSPSCPASAPFQIGYAATPGYDRATGLGSVDAGMLATHWAPSVATTTSLAVSSPTAAVGTSETFTATVTPVAAGFGSPLGGQVQFSIDGADVGSPVPVAKSSAVYSATYSTSTLTGGAHAIRAAYGGNLVYLASASGSAAVSVTDFSITATPTGPVTAGGSAASTLTVTALNGFAGTVNLACAPNPTDGISCQVQPTSVMLGPGSTTQTATLTLTTTAPPAPAMAGAGILAAFALFGLGRRRRRGVAIGLALLLLASTSCGGGGGGGSAAVRPAKKTGTPAGTYSIGVTASAGSASHAVGVSLTVQ